MIVGTPSGIGDWSWLWSKVYGVRGEIEGFEIADGWPYRTSTYVDLCFPEAKQPAVYADGKDDRPKFTYQTIQMFTAANKLDAQFNVKWSDVQQLGAARVLLEPNRHLELGRRLEDWLPDLETHFHYPIYTTASAMQAAKLLGRTLAQHPMQAGPVVGVSCASYRGSEAWKTWGRDEWVDCLGRVMKLGWRPVLLGGSWDDLTYGVAASLELPDLVGKTNTAEMVEILRLLDAYAGFSSGLNVIRTVLDRPAFALWPDFQCELSTSWVPPAMLESHRYVGHLWRPVDTVWPVLRQHLRQCEAEAKPWSNGASHDEPLIATTDRPVL